MLEQMFQGNIVLLHHCIVYVLRHPSLIYFPPPITVSVLSMNLFQSLSGMPHHHVSYGCIVIVQLLQFFLIKRQLLQILYVAHYHL